VAAKSAPKDGLSHLRVSLTDTAYIGPGRADLLQFIAETGSIAEAAKRMGMSYKRAWGLVQALNEGFGALVETSRGGSGQGGAVLTDAGQTVLTRYRAMQDKTRAAIADDVTALGKLIIDMSGRK
jgi:molybdate transport system regulatory protein